MANKKKIEKIRPHEKDKYALQLSVLASLVCYRLAGSTSETVDRSPKPRQPDQSAPQGRKRPQRREDTGQDKRRDEGAAE